MAPSGSIQPVAYYLYRNSLSNQIATISANQKLRYEDHNRKNTQRDTYYLIAVDANGNQSTPIQASL